jgi:hypothetical protein
MDDSEQEELIRLYDAGQPKAVRVSFTVTIEMTRQQRDGYAAAHGADFVDLEVKGRFPQEAPEALRSIPWVRDFARVKITNPKIEKG